jgi:hypothetical protein
MRAAADGPEKMARVAKLPKVAELMRDKSIECYPVYCIDGRLSADMELLEASRDKNAYGKPKAPLASQAFFMHDRV